MNRDTSPKRIHAKTVIDIETGAVEGDDFWLYEGPVALAGGAGEIPADMDGFAEAPRVSPTLEESRGGDARGSLWDDDPGDEIDEEVQGLSGQDPDEDDDEDEAAWFGEEESEGGDEPEDEGEVDRRGAPEAREAEQPDYAAQLSELREQLEQQNEEAKTSFQQELAQVVARSNNYIAGLHQQLQAQNSQVQERAKEFAVLQKELELLRHSREAEAEKDLSPIDKFQRQLERESKANLDSEIGKVREEFNSALEQEREQTRKLREQAQTQANLNHYRSLNETAVAEQLAALPPKIAAVVSEEHKMQILNYAAAHNMEPKEAAAAWEKHARKVVRALDKARGQGRKAKREKGQKIPKGVTKTSRHAKGRKKTPSTAQLRKMGYEGDMPQLDYVMDQRPPLSRATH